MARSFRHRSHGWDLCYLERKPGAYSISLQFGLYIACDPHIIMRDSIEYIVRRVERLKSPEPEVTHVRIRGVLLYSEDIHGGNKVMTLRLEPELRKRLDGLAKAQRRSRSFIAAEAIREYVAVKNSKVDE